jgi:pilus assembly protein FimV
MRLRQLVLACGLTSLVLSPYVSALGLGEVKLKSTLNQPLEAEVKLLDTRDLTAEQILVALASPADFERNGVDRLFFYTEFQFQVDLEAADGPKVVITSRSPVREPYLNFLIEARWTAGRLLREYTLLMDLPTFDEGGATQAVQTAVTSNKSQQPRTTTSTPKATSDSGYTSEPRPVSSARQPSLSGDEYEVRSNDTLWEIALRARPDSSVSVHQSMMALYRANPEAFINGNINRLRRGQVLRVPDASEMKSLNKSDAVSQFTQATGDSDSGAQLNASRRTSSTRTESAEVSGRVKLAAPSAGTASAGQGSGANDGAGKALESELAVTLEELDKSKAEFAPKPKRKRVAWNNRRKATRLFPRVKGKQINISVTGLGYIR